MKREYIEVIGLIDRLHRRYMEVLGVELGRLDIKDLTAAQAMILFNLADGRYTMGDLTERGYYHGSNVSYNIRKMSELDYVAQERSRHDRRQIEVFATEKGLRLWREIDDLLQRQSSELSQRMIDTPDLQVGVGMLSRLEAYWSTARHSGVLLREWRGP